MAKTIALTVEIIGADKSVQQIGALDTALQNLGAEKRALRKATRDAQKGIEDINKDLKRETELFRTGAISEKEFLSTTQKLKQIKAGYNATLSETPARIGKITTQEAALRAERSKLIRETQQEIKQNKAAQGSYDQLSARLSSLKSKYNEMGAAARASAQGQALNAQIAETKAELAGVNKEFDNYASQSGKAKAQTNELTTSFKNLAGALGITLGLTAIVGAGREVVTTFRDFEHEMNRVKAISGATDAEFLRLEDDARRLGESTQKQASEVAGLQVEYAKLGFTTDQIISATEATLDLSIATDTNLVDAARVAGGTIRAFGLQAEDTTRVADTMTAAFNGSALDLNKFETAMRNVAPVAKTFGFSLENTTALIGQLVNANFDASQAGTATRNILLNLADANGKLAQEFGKPVSTLPELVSAMVELRDRGVDLGETLELTDKRSVAAFNTFLDGAEDVQAFSDKLDAAGGTASDTADIMDNDLLGAQKRNESAWEELAIKLSEDSQPAMVDVMEILAELAKFLARNTGAIKTVGKAIVLGTAAWIAYKLAVLGYAKASALATRAMAVQRLMAIQSAAGIGRATVAMRIFNNVVKQNPLIFAASAALIAVVAYQKFAEQTRTLKDMHRDFNKELGKEQGKMIAAFEIAKQAKEGTNERRRAIERLNEVYGKYGVNLDAEKATLEEIQAAQKLANDELIRNIAIKSRASEIERISAELAVKKNAQFTIEKELLAENTSSYIDLLQALSQLRGIEIEADGTGLEKLLALQRQVAVENITASELFGEIDEQNLGGSVSETQRAIIQNQLEMLNNLPQLQKEYEATTKEIEKITQFYDQYTKAAEKNIEANKRAAGSVNTDAFESLIKIQEKLLDQAKKLPETTEAELIVKNRRIQAIEIEIRRLKNLGIETDKAAKKRKEAIEKTERLITKLERELAKARVSFYVDEFRRKRELATLEAKFRIDDLKAQLTSQAELNTLTGVLLAKKLEANKLINQRIAQEERRLADELLEIGRETSENDLDSLEQAFEKELELERQHTRIAILEIRERYARQQITEEEARAEIEAAFFASLNKRISWIDDFEQVYIDSIRRRVEQEQILEADAERLIAQARQRFSAQRIQAIEVDGNEQIRIVEQRVDRELISEEEGQRQILEIRRNMLELQLGMLDESNEATKEKYQQLVTELAEINDTLQSNEERRSWIAKELEITDEQAAQYKAQAEAAANDIANSLFTIAQQAEEKRLAAQLRGIRDAKTQELDELEDKYKKELITQEQYNERKQAIESKYGEAELEAEKASFERQKELSISRAVIEGAVAIVKTFATFGYPAGVPLAALQATATAAQVAVIQGEQFQEGGIINGPSHANGGVRAFLPDGSDVELEGEEGVINKRSMRSRKIMAVMGTPASIASEINAIDGNGVRFAGRAVRFAQAGGVTPRPAPVSVTREVREAADAGRDSIADQVAQAVGGIKVSVLESEITETQTDVRQFETEADFFA